MRRTWRWPLLLGCGLAGCPSEAPRRVPLDTEGSNTTTSDTTSPGAGTRASDSTSLSGSEHAAASTISGSSGDTSATEGGESQSSGGDAGEPGSTESASTSSGSGEPPVTVPSDALLWFAADRGVTHTQGSVSGIEDQSSHGHHAIQSEAHRMPLLVDVSGTTMLEFDGEDDALQLPAGFRDFAGLSFFAVVEAMENPGCAGILSFSNGDDVDDIELGRHVPNLLYYEVVGDYVEGAPQGFEVGRRFLVSIVQSPGGAVELRLDTALTGSGTIPLPEGVLRGENYLGRDAYDECPSSFHGRVGEVLLYSRELGVDEQQQVFAYLELRWDLALDLP